MLRYLSVLFSALLLTIGLVACGGSDDSSSDDTNTGSAPVITSQPQSVSIASGATTTLNVAASGTATLSYQWHLNGSAINGATATSYTTGAAGSYTVVVSNDYGSVTSNAATITVTDTDNDTTNATWNILTGAYAPDLADTSGYLPLTVALDTLSVSSTSSRLSVSNTSTSVVTVALDGAAAITLTRDSYGLTVRSTLSGGTHMAYQLTGTGSTPLTVYSDNDYKLVLTSANITSGDGPALNLQSKQTAFIELSGTSVLADSSTYSDRLDDDGDDMDLKATLFAEGPLVFSGSGSLRINATPKHALASDAHVRLLSGTVTLNAAAKDGLRANDAFVMDGGNLNITTPAGKGIKVEGQEDDSQPLGFIAINSGTIAITSYDKAITASWEGDEDGDTATTADDPDPRVTINGGTVTVTTTGTPYEDNNTADGDDSLSPEGVESKSTLTINDGTLTINATDDALNAGTAIAMTGGHVYANSSAGNGFDSNGTIAISGGVAVAIGAAQPEAGMDSDNATFAVTGGVFVAIGGSNSTPTANAATQNLVSVRNVSTGLWALRDASGNAAFAYQVPSAAGAMLISSPLITTGTTYNVVTGGTVGSADETYQGLYINPTTHSGGTTGRSFTVSSRVTSF
ncbi:carbohydrate-binding domain-containing protein [Ottowia sp.]|uniref:carbohydrate-binding domain-containing protein n=1 Tax=Ottowia sp. TaxID=1898956 RepID=UPI003A893294